MIVHAPAARIVLTSHALARFRARVDRRASMVDIVAAVKAAVVQRKKPGWVEGDLPHAVDAWLVSEGWACPLRLSGDGDGNADDFDYAAMTVLRRQRRVKADVRAWREQRRDTDVAA